jgi:microcystin-dependent protein
MKIVLCSAVLALLATTAPALAFHGEQFLGEVRAFPYDYCPEEWTPAAGQIIRIASHHTLFALLGTRYGGNGTDTFALPDLRVAVLVSKPQEGKAPAAEVRWCIAIDGRWPSRP